jgi:hypothetical protein
VLHIVHVPIARFLHVDRRLIQNALQSHSSPSMTQPQFRETVNYAMRGEKMRCPRLFVTNLEMSDQKSTINAIMTRRIHQSFASDDDCHVPPTVTLFLKPLGSGAFLFRRPSRVELSKLSSNAPLFLTWRLAAAATAGEC